VNESGEVLSDSLKVSTHSNFQVSQINSNKVTQEGASLHSTCWNEATGASEPRQRQGRRNLLFASWQGHHYFYTVIGYKLYRLPTAYPNSILQMKYTNNRKVIFKNELKILQLLPWKPVWGHTVCLWEICV